MVSRSSSASNENLSSRRAMKFSGPPQSSGGQAPPAAGAEGIGLLNLRRQLVFDADLMAPGDIQIVIIDKPRTLAESQRCQCHVR